jgi:hypothetical protein
MAAIETTIEQTLVNVTRKVPTSITIIEKSAPNLNAKKIRTSTDEEAKRTIRTWERTLPHDLAIDRALHMLAAFGLDVTLDVEQRRALSELAELRNVILHNGGRIDKRFKDKCPWRQDQIGNALLINHSRLGNYFDAATALATKLMQCAVGSSYILVSRGT